MGAELVLGKTLQAILDWVHYESLVEQDERFQLVTWEGGKGFGWVVFNESRLVVTRGFVPGERRTLWTSLIDRLRRWLRMDR